MVTVYAGDLTHAFQAQLAAERMVAVGRWFSYSSDPELMRRLRSAEAALDNALSALDRADVSSRERDLLTESRTAAARYRDVFDDLLEKGRERDPTSMATAFRETLLPARADLGARLEDLVAHKEALQAAGRRAARRMDAQTLAFMVGLGALGVTLSLILAWAFTRHLGHIYDRERESAVRATRASAAKEELLGVVAHDLRNPVGAIALKAALIDRGTDEERTRKHAASIGNLATRVEAFIQTLLDAASIEAKRLSVTWKLCSVADLITTTMETFSTLAAQKSVTLEQDLGRGGLAFWGDRERIGQVLSNLVGNAIKFTPDGGSVTIRAVESGFHARFEVRDTGPGIVSQHLPHVFDRFWKADIEGRKGTGLGLYIAKGIVEGHRGRIWVESRVGTGSAFIFELPIAPPSATNLAAIDQPTRGEDYDSGQHPHS